MWRDIHVMAVSANLLHLATSISCEMLATTVITVIAGILQEMNKFKPPNTSQINA